MSCFSIEEYPQARTEKCLMAEAFQLGWLAADEAQLGNLPEVMAKMLDVAWVQMTLTEWGGPVRFDYAFPGDALGVQAAAFTEEMSLDVGSLYGLKIRVGSMEKLQGRQTRALSRASSLLQTALEFLFVGQYDRRVLGLPFARFSDREWKVMRAMEGSKSEKEIADEVATSVHTVHGYVKNIYRQLDVRGRLEALGRLKQARHQVRRKTLAQFGQAEADQASNLGEPERERPA